MVKKRISPCNIKLHITSVILAILTISATVYIFIKNNNNITINCSYLNPFSVDVLALLGSLFLIIEGIWSIHKFSNVQLKIQAFRLIRVLFGLAVFTMHVLQMKYSK